MGKKVSIDQIMDDIVSVQNQIDGLNMLLVQKKQTMAKYFEQSGKTSLSNEDCTVYVQERTTVDYDIDAIQEKLPKEVYSQFIEKEYVADWDNLVRFMKAKGIKGSEIRNYFFVNKKIDKEKLSSMYERGKLSVHELEGCYTAKVTKSVALKLKNVKREINLT